MKILDKITESDYNVIVRINGKDMKMGKQPSRTNYTRVRNINLVVEQLGKMSPGATATDISLYVNLSRQAILDILKHAKTWGYVGCNEFQHRKNVKGYIWFATDYGKQNANWYMKAFRDAQTKGKQLPLL